MLEGVINLYYNLNRFIGRVIPNLILKIRKYLLRQKFTKWHLNCSLMSIICSMMEENWEGMKDGLIIAKHSFFKSESRGYSLRQVLIVMYF